MGLATAATHHELPAAVAAHVASPTAGANVAAASAAAEQTVLVAHLTPTGTATGTGEAAFHTSTVRGVTSSKLGVEVQGAAASSTFDVVVGGVTLGQLTTNDNGNGEVVFTNSPKGDQVALPAGFMVTSTSTITLKLHDSTNTTDTLTGTFAAVGKPASPPAAQPVNLKATLTGSTEVSTAKGVAVYHTVTNRNGTRSELEVVVSGAAANTSYNVTVGSATLGTLTTDARGRGVLRVNNLSTTIAANNVITLSSATSGGGTLSGTFTKVGKK
jgi:hypothetical protein